MSIEFIKQINNYVIESILSESDDDIISMIGHSGYPEWGDIKNTKSMILQAVNENRQNRLELKKAEYLSFKQNREDTLKSIMINRSIQEMLSDIVKAMQNKDKVPKGLLMAFREQGQGGSEEDIQNIWESLVELGLINLNDDD